MGMEPSAKLVLYYKNPDDKYLNDPLLSSEDYYVYFENEELSFGNEEDYGEGNEATFSLRLTYGWGERVKTETVLQKQALLERWGQYLVGAYGGSYTIDLLAAFS